MSSRAIVLGLAVLAGLFPADAWAQRSIRCKSQNFRYNWCSSGEPIRYARIQHQRSDSPCIQGRSWGWQRSGIWVDNGCEGDFFIETYYNPPPPPPDYGGGWGGGGGGWGSGGGNWGGGAYDPAPSWAVGQWQTYEPVNGFYRSLSVYPTGSATYTGGGGTRSGYWTRNGEVRLSDGLLLEISRRSRVEIEVYHPNHGRLLMRRVD
jgi:hypothetical protein